MFNSDILRAAPTKQVGGFSISFLQCVLVISGICRFWVSTHWLLHVIRYGNKKVARVQLRAAIQKQEKGPGTPLLESLSGFPHQDPSGVFVSFLSAFKASSCTLAKTDSRRYSETEKKTVMSNNGIIFSNTQFVCTFFTFVFWNVLLLLCGILRKRSMPSWVLGSAPRSQACFLWDIFLVPMCICLEELSQQGQLLGRPLWHWFPVVSIAET